MPFLKLIISYNKNENLAISPSDLIENYLFGIPMCSNDGRRLSNQAIKQHILNAQQSVENFLNVKLTKQVIEESRDFVREEFNSWGYIRTFYPINYIDNLYGYINDVCQVTYPKEWLSIKRSESVAVYRNVHLIPNSGSSSGATMSQHSVVYNGISPHLGWFGKTFIPNYWRMRYVTGWDKIPNDIIDYVSKLAAVNVLGILGDIIYGVGLTSISISLDGVSQNTPLTRSSSGGLFSGRMKQYIDDLQRDHSILRLKYRGITFEVL